MPMRQQVQNRLPLLQQQVQTKKDALTTAAVQNIALTAGIRLQNFAPAPGAWQKSPTCGELPVRLAGSRGFGYLPLQRLHGPLRGNCVSLPLWRPNRLLVRQLVARTQGGLHSARPDPQ